jgi:methionyl-tRNA formyltransferase
MKPCYVVATIKPWNIAAFHRHHRSLAGHWELLEKRDDLKFDVLRRLDPDYVFFPHWSWKVPDEIIREFNCVCFHETDLPYGRGGSPIQNLIAGGKTATKISALRMVQELDAGPIYLKRPLSLAGSAQEIFERAAETVWDMIDEIIAKKLAPVPQSGVTTVFDRRTPTQSQLPAAGSPRQLYDHIRMLDAETYPRAFLDFGRWTVEFSRAELVAGEVRARVVIRPRGETE